LERGGRVGWYEEGKGGGRGYLKSLREKKWNTGLKKLLKRKLRLWGGRGNAGEKPRKRGESLNGRRKLTTVFCGPRCFLPAGKTKKTGAAGKGCEFLGKMKSEKETCGGRCEEGSYTWGKDWSSKDRIV